MKRLFTLAAMLLAIAPVWAQETSHDEDNGDEKKVASAFNIPTKAGTLMLGSNFILGNVDIQENTDAVYNIGITPRIGVFVANNLALGLSVNANIQGQGDVSNTAYGASAFMRAYFSRSPVARAQRLQFFAEIGAGVAGVYTHAAKADDATTEGRFYAMPGINYFFNQHVALEVGAQYAYTTGKIATHSIGWNIGLQVFLKHGDK